ncbi:metal-sensitive transcriptional regulator [Salinibacterium sp. SWN1162]|uniref:metal-sensitive transcriptional regulator n=1 Tax=Salinibacterium sp. SWN1162 TaxID=2792053 RepID=UPI0018CFA04A|nr:metal-sensitive transcriptional regulator [Salinibacterium sp. SWN1162]MBH0009517.1 metal-sensitive transcriptional regulator [Salinibacterium sp. SWN1162]
MESSAAEAAISAEPDAQKKIANRLRRAHGQLGALITTVESGAGCRDVVHQLAAVSKALDRAGFLVISEAMRECLLDPDATGSPQSEEIEKLFLSLA